MENNGKALALWLAMSIPGMMLNTLGIALRDASWIRYLLMSTGLILLLGSVLVAMHYLQEPKAPEVPSREDTA